MRIVVLSDTHGDYRALAKVLDRNKNADHIIHLGDGEKELDRYILDNPDIAPKITHVAGNCDFNSLSEDVAIIPVMDHRIFATHGYHYNVKLTLNGIKRTAAENGCDIILFGHTHERFQSYEDGMWIMNPGSAACPRDGNKPSFGNIDISPAGVITNIADV